METFFSYTVFIYNYHKNLTGILFSSKHYNFHFDCLHACFLLNVKVRVIKCKVYTRRSPYVMVGVHQTVRIYQRHLSQTTLVFKMQ